MSPPEDELEEINYEISDLKDYIEDIKKEIENVNYKIDDLKSTIEDYEIYLFPTTIQRYLRNLVNLQQIKSESFFPSYDKRIKQYFQASFPSFDYKKIKYKSTDTFNVISKIISDQGRSGSSFIENMDNVIDINKPLLLFYGIEQISAFYSNLHFNFTWVNNDFKPIRNTFAKHGIDAFQFKNEIDLTNPVEDILSKKIKLKKFGLAQRFFLTISSDFLQYFNDELEISLIDLLKLFFIFSSIPTKLKKIFEELYGSSNDLSEDLIKIYHRHRQNLDLFLIYLLSFVFCHMCRYKLYTWTLILNSEKKNIGYFITYFLNYSRRNFIKRIFDQLSENDEIVKGRLGASFGPIVL